MELQEIDDPEPACHPQTVEEGFGDRPVGGQVADVGDLQSDPTLANLDTHGCVQIEEELRLKADRNKAEIALTVHGNVEL